MTYPSNDGNFEVENPEEGCEDPDVDDAEDGEDESPDECGRDGEDGGEESVEPELGVSEDDERQLPDAVEPLRRVRLGDDVVKVQLKSKCAKSLSEFNLL